MQFPAAAEGQLPVGRVAHQPVTESRPRVIFDGEELGERTPRIGVDSYVIADELEQLFSIEAAPENCGIPQDSPQGRR